MFLRPEASYLAVKDAVYTALKRLLVWRTGLLTLLSYHKYMKWLLISNVRYIGQKRLFCPFYQTLSDILSDIIVIISQIRHFYISENVTFTFPKMSQICLKM
jgi:hypothetical protein